jgi:predicted small lipoprotein YifL
MPDDLVADSCVLMAYSVSALTMLNLHMNRFNQSIKTLLFLAAMALLLVACGQKGPLYLPAPEPGPVQASEVDPKEAEENEAKAGTEDDIELPTGSGPE